MKADTLAWKLEKAATGINVHCLAPTTTRKRFQGLQQQRECQINTKWSKRASPVGKNIKPNNFKRRVFLMELEDKALSLWYTTWKRQNAYFSHKPHTVAFLWIVPFAFFPLPRKCRTSEYKHHKMGASVKTDCNSSPHLQYSVDSSKTDYLHTAPIIFSFP